MSTLIFDIETVGEDWDAFDETTKHMLSRWADRTLKSDEEKEAALKDLKEGLGFSPLTGSIVASVSMISNERRVRYITLLKTKTTNIRSGNIH